MTITCFIVYGDLASAQPSVTYHVRFPNVIHHEAEIEMSISGLEAGEKTSIRMSRTSPGRYALHEFVKNIHNVRITDGSGRWLSPERPDLHQWDVTPSDDTIRFRYTIFADHADGTYSGIDESHAHLNMPATFVWPRDGHDWPIEVVFYPPDPGWRVATQLLATEKEHRFSAPDLDYFLDSPTELSDFSERVWSVGDSSGQQVVRIALHHAGSENEVDRFASDTKRIVMAARDVFGEYPRFEGGTYTFIACYLPHVFGDGMEHRNSTILTSTGSLARNSKDLLDTVSHEFFHAWNVERLRPASLEPFNWEAPNVSDELWFAEGFTSYYAPLILRRAGVTSDAEFGEALAGQINAVFDKPGRWIRTPVGMSRMATFVDRASWVDATSFHDTFVSYYPWGAVIALGLDLTLRSRYPGLTLDDFMRSLWERFGRAETPYRLDDVEAVLAELTGETEFAVDFFDRYIRGYEMPDLEELLFAAGFLLQRKQLERPWLAVSFEDAAPGARIATYPQTGTTLYWAGLTRGDVVRSVDGRPIPDAAAMNRVIASHRSGDVLTFEADTRAGRKEVEVDLAPDPTWEVLPFEAVGWQASAEEKAMREGWLEKAGR